MTSKTLLSHFHFLESAKHNTYDDDLPSLFEEPNKSEYWLLSDLITILAPQIDPTNQNTIIKFAKTELYSSFDFSFTPKQSSNPDFFNQHVIKFDRPIYTDTKTYHYVTDYKLSRFAILCTLQKHNSNKIFDLVYFMSPSDTPIEQLYAMANNFARIPARENLKKQERQLSGVISHYGIDHQLAQGLLQSILFDTNTLEQFRQQHNIPAKKPVADYLGRLALNAKANAIFNTLYNLDTKKSKSTTFTNKLRQCAYEQRVNMLYKYGITPENNIYPQPIHKTIQEFKTKYKYALTKYAHEKLR